MIPIQASQPDESYVSLIILLDGVKVTDVEVPAWEANGIITAWSCDAIGDGRDVHVEVTAVDEEEVA